MNTDNILHLSDLNLAEFIREMARWNAAGEIWEQNDLVLTKGAGRSPITNSAMNLSPAHDANSGSDTFDRIQSFYGARQSGFSIYIRKHADQALETICRQKDMLQVSDAPGMMVDMQIPCKQLPSGMEIREIDDVAGVVDFASVMMQSYVSLDMPPSIGEKIFASPERLLRPYNYLVVAYDKGHPVTAAMVIFSHSIAGIYWVGTVQNARGKGLAEACVSAVTNEALRRGAAFVALQASKYGEPIYRRMGFKEFTRYPWYMRFYK
jgi:GNAT superfamily N-acetyltransferase